MTSNSENQISAYKPVEIEKKWQEYWSQNQTFRAANPQEEGSEKTKFYILDMFPYPSGAGLHVGHPLGYIASDIYARYKRNKGFNVLHPMGYDSFGLPAEQYAIQTGRHPEDTTTENIQRYRKQLDRIGFSFDWSRMVKTSKPEYYKWTQWIFIQLFHSWYNSETQKAEPIQTLVSIFEKSGSLGFTFSDETLHFSSSQWIEKTDTQKEEVLMQFRLAFLSEAFVNWCPALGTVLANDEVKDGFSERGGHPVERKKMKQWSLRITAYADRLLDGLEELDWNENVKEIQKNWIGKSKGCSIKFGLKSNKEQHIEVFTTRPDTLFGVSYLTLAPEHPLVLEICSEEQKSKVNEYIEYTKTRSERDRQAEVKKITGVFTGAYAIHPFTLQEIPIWIGEYVLAGYGTGAVMAVPAHDERDFAFAKHFSLPIPQVVKAPSNWDLSKDAWCEKSGTMIHSDFLNGLEVKEAISSMIQAIEQKGIGSGKTNYRLRDAAFGRQRYWGEPIPVFYENGIAKTMDIKHLPLELPNIDSFLPTQTGEPPLARAIKWNYLQEKGLVENGNGWPIETTTMPGWAGSSWYFLRYMDPENIENFADSNALNYWKQVDFYVGGAEHATGHLLYARFWSHFLYDLGLIPEKEPFKKLLNQGMIQGESALIHRIKNTNTFVSAELAKDYETTTIHIDVNLLKNNEADIQQLKQWREEFESAEYILGDKGLQCERIVEKMSKSKWNVVSPDVICEQYGADTLRMYEMFLGPIQDSKPWNMQGIEGVFKFLKKFWRLFHSAQEEFFVSTEKANNAELKVLHKTIKKITSDIETLSFNTSVSAFMICVNELQDLKCYKTEILEPLVILLSPFAPHICEELWEKLGNSGGITNQKWPEFNEKFLEENSFNYPISINGKVRTQIEFSLSETKEKIEQTVLNNEVVLKWLEGKEAKKFILVPGKIINVVI